MFVLFFFNDTATTEIYTLSLHDALPISRCRSGFCRQQGWRREGRVGRRRQEGRGGLRLSLSEPRHAGAAERDRARSEEHTSELQSHLNLVCRLLLEKKKT